MSYTSEDGGDSDKAVGGATVEGRPRWLLRCAASRITEVLLRSDQKRSLNSPVPHVRVSGLAPGAALVTQLYFSKWQPRFPASGPVYE